jgi:hypothetical protein
MFFVIIKIIFYPLDIGLKIKYIYLILYKVIIFYFLINFYFESILNHFIKFLI